MIGSPWDGHQPEDWLAALLAVAPIGEVIELEHLARELARDPDHHQAVRFFERLLDESNCRDIELAAFLSLREDERRRRA